MHRRLALILVSAAVAATLATSWIIGTLVSAPQKFSVGPPPSDLQAETVRFDSKSGSAIAGWLVRGETGRGVVLLLHGIRASRLQMIDRARMLKRHGFATLLIDLQAHGESGGKAITFGYLESKDAAAAIHYLQQTLPGEKIGVIGSSLGGAAALLASPPLAVDAVIAEQVFADIETATSNRIAMFLGRFGSILTPILTWQLKWRLGVDAPQLAPAKAIAGLKCPVLIVAGADDIHATMQETDRIWANAPNPKELWVVPAADHNTLVEAAGPAYEQRVTAFFRKHLWR